MTATAGSSGTTTLGAEGTAVQRPIVRYAIEAGWTFLTRDEALRLRLGTSGIVLRNVLLEQVQRLNPGVVDTHRAEDIAARLLRVAPSIQGNYDAWEFLNGLKSVHVAEERREKNVRLLDAEHTEANTFHVTEEYTYVSGQKQIRCDVVFFINGIPVLILEAKAASHVDGINEALVQIRRYHQHAPDLLAQAQLYALTHLVHSYYGATWNLSRKALFTWRDTGMEGDDFETLVKTFVAPRRLLRIITEFILFTRRDDELVKIVLRPHQMRAVERVIRRAHEDGKRRALIWHTQGSGKTFTMITVARQLMADPGLNKPTVLLLVDRNELEQQLFGNIEAVGGQQAIVAQSKRHLRELLATDRRGMIVSMIHKFDDVPPDLNTRSNIFVLVDEAHRTTGGDLGNYLMGALPNATYIGFTGTPIDRTAHGKGTFKVFGTDDEQGYLDKYSIRESIADGTTVQLHYSLAPNDLRADEETLEREFLALADAEGMSDVEELNHVLERAVTLRNMLKNSDRITKIAAFVAEHFTSTIEPMGYKAMLVAVDREACVRYKRALDQVLPPEYSAVVFSAGHNDSDELAAFHISEEQEEQVRKDFRRPDTLPKILIVTEKLLTGYDAPILYGMYLDKPMRDHVLLQAIARVNRPYEDADGRRKPAGFVLDFVGIFDKLERALAFDSAEVSGVIHGIDVLQQRFQERMSVGTTDYLPLLSRGVLDDKAVEAVLTHFRDQETRQAMYTYYREVQEIYEILSPDPFLANYVPTYNALASIYRLVRGAYEPHLSVDREILHKTAQLVQEHTESGFLHEPSAVYELNAEALEAIANEPKSDTVKVFNLIKAITTLEQEQAATQPHLIAIAQRAVDIAKAFEEGQLSTRETLEELEELIRKYREAEQSPERKELTPESFSVYWLLSYENNPDAMAVARAARDAFQAAPYWKDSRKQEGDVRVALYKALKATQMDARQMIALVDKTLGLLRNMEQ